MQALNLFHPFRRFRPVSALITLVGTTLPTWRHWHLSLTLTRVRIGQTLYLFCIIAGIQYHIHLSGYALIHVPPILIVQSVSRKWKFNMTHKVFDKAL